MSQLSFELKSVFFKLFTLALIDKDRRSLLTKFDNLFECETTASNLFLISKSKENQHLKMASDQASNKRKVDDNYENPDISSRTKNFYLNEKSVDVYFICDDSNDERIPAHKVILSMASDAFDAMFHGELRERGDVRIADASAEGFKEFLKFFYFDQIKITMEHIEEVVYLCTKYVFTTSIKICESFLLDSLNIENVCFSYGLAITYNLNALKQKCEEIIVQNTLNVLQSDGFLKCDRFVLAEILKFDTLSCIEIDLFKWCMVWVKAAGREEKVTRRLIDKELGESFHDIRFGSMIDEHLTQLLSEYSNIFESDENQEIAQLIASKNFHSALFGWEPRPFPWNKKELFEMKIDRIHGERRNLHGHLAFNFSPKKTILLGKIELRTIYNKNDPKNTLTEENTFFNLLIFKKLLLDDEQYKIVLRQQVELKNLYGWYYVILHKPVVVSPRYVYSIRVVPKKRSTIGGNLMKDTQDLSDKILGFKSFICKNISSKDYRL